VDLQVRTGSIPVAGTSIIELYMVDKKKDKPGPKPDHVRIEGDWEKAVGDALKKKRPKEGWPEPEKGSQKDKS
jgi:hypothetical protein